MKFPDLNKKKITRWIKVLVLVYVIIGITFYHYQEKLIFKPEPLAADFSFNFSAPHKEVFIPIDKNNSHHLVQFTTGTAEGVVLFFHGNKDNVSHYAHAAETFTAQGYEVWMVDYPGYGKSTGILSEEGLYQQALQVYKLARSRFDANQVIIYGRSLGSGIAAQLASVRHCRQLILETPYYNMPSLVRRYLWMYPVSKMMKYEFPTHQYLQQVTAPVTIFHGTSDWVIPYGNASKLKASLKKNDTFITIEGGSHNNLLSYDTVQNKLLQLLQQ